MRNKDVTRLRAAALPHARGGILETGIGSGLNLLSYILFPRLNRLRRGPFTGIAEDGIARALINQPKLILADEPTGNLDETNEAVVLKLLRELHEAGHTILVVTHSQAIGNLADRRVELEHGSLARITAPSLAKE